jgi:putative ABC transport system permease protein
MSEAALPSLALEQRAPDAGHRRPKMSFVARLRRFFNELRDAVVQAAVSLFSHKLRAALTIVGIAIGIMAVIIIFMVEAGMSSGFARQLSTLGPNTLFVHKWKWGANGNDWWKYKDRPQISMLDLRALQANTTLPIAVAPMISTSATVSYGSRDVKNVDVRGTVDGYLDATGWTIRRGRFLTQLDEELGSNVCVIGADIEDAFFKNDDPLGQPLRAGPNLRCTIVGIFGRKGMSFGNSQDRRVVVPLSAFMRTFGSKRGLVVAVVAPEGKVRETEDEVTTVMRNARHLAPDQEENFSVNRQDKLLEGFNQTMMATNVTGILVGIITALVAGIGIMNILLVSVKERTREIGVRRALGARRSTILMQFLCEAVMVAVVGGLCGISLASGAAWLIDSISPVPATIDPRVVVGGVIGSGVLGAIFGLWPALSAALLQPIEALRYE